MEPKLRFNGTHDLLGAEIGHEITPVDMVIDEDMVERHAFANDDYNPWYMKDSPFGGRVSPPTFLSYDTDIMIWNHFILPEGKGIWAKQEFDFVKPLKVGEKIRITGKITDKVHKRGRDHITFEFLVSDSKGTELVRMRTVHAFPLIVTSDK